MLIRRLGVLIMLILTATIISGQTNFRFALEKVDPVKEDAILDKDEKLKIHQAFLDKAIDQKDSLSQLYGNIYLFYDHVIAGEYAESQNYLLEAKNIAQQSGQIGWQGWVNYRAGIVYVQTNNIDKAINTYRKAIELCTSVGDSLCVGESYEQLSIMTALNGNYEEAETYFSIALPLLEKHGRAKNLCAAYTNYGSILSMKGKPREAILRLSKSIEYCGKAKRYEAQASGMNNLADAYRRMGDFDNAIDVYISCIQFNEKHKFVRNLVTNYMGLHEVYKEQKNYRKASELLISHYNLKDSLMGLEVQERVAKIELEFEDQQKELELQKSKIQLLMAKNRLRIILIISTFFGILAALILAHLYRTRQRITKQLSQNKENLKYLTQTLIRKNTSIKLLEDKISDLSTQGTQIIDKHAEINLYDQTILTADDWEAFKVNFEKVHSGYIFNLRKAHSLSEAEERLFLLLKLNLTRNEIASILGVSPDTVKKTRTRLRKRLNLKSEESLSKFAEVF